MTQTFFRAAILSSLTLSALGFTACKATHLTATSKDAAYNPKTMQRVLVIAVVRKPETQQMLENAFVLALQKRQSTGVAAHTLIRAGEKLEEVAWKKLVADNHFDTVIVSRLTDLEVIEKDVDPKILVTRDSYGYYNAGYQMAYQPGFTIRKETAAVETRVFDAASDKLMWSAHSKTNIEFGRDPEAQVRDFVRLMMNKIYE